MHFFLPQNNTNIKLTRLISNFNMHMKLKKCTKCYTMNGLPHVHHEFQVCKRVSRNSSKSPVSPSAAPRVVLHHYLITVLFQPWKFSAGQPLTLPCSRPLYITQSPENFKPLLWIVADNNAVYVFVLDRQKDWQGFNRITSYPSEWGYNNLNFSTKFTIYF